MVSLPPPSPSRRDPTPSQDTPEPAAPTPVAAASADDEEDLLRDVLDELDKERTKRAHVEADMRKLMEEKQALERELAQVLAKQQQQQQAPKEEDIVSRHAFCAMEAQVQGFKQLVDALTMGKPAIAAAAVPRRKLRRSSTRVMSVLQRRQSKDSISS